MAKETTTAATKAAKTTATAKAEKIDTTVLEQENAEMKAQLAEMKAQMEAFTKMMATMAQGRVAVAPPPTPRADRMIRFVSLKECTIILKASKESPAWTIEGRFNYVDIPEREARNIVSYMSNYMRRGSVYITDAEFVKDNGLDAYYSTLLSDTDLRELLDNDVIKVVDTYKSVNDNQKEIIIEMIQDYRREGRKIDSNILVELEELSGKNLIHPDEE